MQVGAWRNVERESPLRVTLAQGVSAGERMDLTVQKAVELGVAAIQPLLTERSVVRLQGARLAARIEHWRKIVISACEQCGRNRIPELRQATDVETYCRSVRKAEPRILLSPGAERRLRELEISSAVTLAAGPEAGFSEKEEEALQRAGFMPVGLGPRVLRTETAAPAALAALNALRGDF
jgi:16S rRNA (uracil1498-N3)-methyltransferase